MKHTTQNRIKQVINKLKLLAFAYTNNENNLVYNWNNLTVTRRICVIENLIFIEKQVLEYSEELEWYKLMIWLRDSHKLGVICNTSKESPTDSTHEPF